MTCSYCKTESAKGQWWHCRGYFGITGTFCPQCYTKISHDSYGKPWKPSEYEKVKEALK